jgi:hypothetical protein
MDAGDRAKALEAQEAAQAEPGMGAALLAVLVMIVSTSILAFLIYLVMVLIVPGERKVNKAASIEQPLLVTQGTKRAAN